MDFFTLFAVQVKEGPKRSVSTTWIPSSTITGRNTRQTCRLIKSDFHDKQKGDVGLFLVPRAQTG
jgi:hypothetical protein